MAIEAGARAGMVAVDKNHRLRAKAVRWLRTGAMWDQAVAYWQTLHSDEGAQFDAVVELKAEDILPQVTWGTSPEMVVTVATVPDPARRSRSVAPPASSAR